MNNLHQVITLYCPWVLNYLQDGLSEEEIKNFFLRTFAYDVSETVIMDLYKWKNGSPEELDRKFFHHHYYPNFEMLSLQGIDNTISHDEDIFNWVDSGMIPLYSFVGMADYICFSMQDGCFYFAQVWSGGLDTYNKMYSSLDKMFLTVLEWHRKGALIKDKGGFTIDYEANKFHTIGLELNPECEYWHKMLEED